MVELQEANRAIGAQIAAVQKSIAPYDEIKADAATVRDDYERLRIAYEVTRELAGERDIDVVVSKILAACFKFVRADRGVVLVERRSMDDAQDVLLSSLGLRLQRRELEGVGQLDRVMGMQPAVHKNRMRSKASSRPPPSTWSVSSHHSLSQSTRAVGPGVFDLREEVRLT